MVGLSDVAASVTQSAVLFVPYFGVVAFAAALAQGTRTKEHTVSSWKRWWLNDVEV